MRKILRKMLYLLFKKNSRNLPSSNELLGYIPQNPKILIIRQHNQLGDMLLSCSLFRAIKEKLPKAALYVLASPENYHAIVSNKYIDKVVVFDKKKFWNPFQLVKFLKVIRKEKFDLTIVPVTVSLSFTSFLIARLSGSKFTIGPEKLDEKENEFSFLFDYKIPVVDNKYSQRHISDKILDIVRPFGFDTADLSEHIFISEYDKKFAVDFFRNVKKLKIGLHIGAGKIPNRWSVKKFAEVINYLYHKYDPFIYLTIGNWDEELLKEILPLVIKQPEVLRNLPIPRIAAIIESSDLFISNDTGIMHVAGATRTPLIALFGPTNPEIWAPPGNNKFYIKKGDDINLIEVNDVINLVDKILQNLIQDRIQ